MKAGRRLPVLIGNCSAPQPPRDSSSAAINGPPFLSGKTITIAGAALQERVEGAVKKAGGNVLSSQIDLQGPHSAEGFIGLTESLEIDQASLQQLLYDLEAGMPYLFVDNLAIQAPQAFGEAEGAPMRVLLVVSGQWRISNDAHGARCRRRNSRLRGRGPGSASTFRSLAGRNRDRKLRA